MRWEDERYVRIYTRDTPDWMAMEWQGRAVFYELSRKVDRSGFVPLGKSGTRGLAGLLRMPVDVVEVGVSELLKDGCVEQVDGGLLIGNFIEAQEARQSDAARKRAQRERDRNEKRDGAGYEESRDLGEQDETGQGVTKRDATSRNVTECHEPSRAVTDGHQESQPVTLSRTVPSRTVPGTCPPDARGRASARGEGEDDGEDPEPTSDTTDGKILAALRGAPPLARCEREGLRLTQCALDLTVEVGKFTLSGKLRDDEAMERVTAAIADVSGKVQASNATTSPLSPDKVARLLATFAYTNLGKPRDAWAAEKNRGRPNGRQRHGPAAPNPAIAAFAPLSPDARPWTPDDKAPL